MLWMLVMVTASGTPIPTGMTYSTLDACYADEDKVAAEYARYYNSQAKAGASKESLGLIGSRMLRGLCVPHPPPKPSGSN
jgi:hypothetical protein